MLSSLITSFYSNVTHLNQFINQLISSTNNNNNTSSSLSDSTLKTNHPTKTTLDSSIINVNRSSTNTFLSNNNNKNTYFTLLNSDKPNFELIIDTNRTATKTTKRRRSLDSICENGAGDTNAHLFASKTKKMKRSSNAKIKELDPETPMPVYVNSSKDGKTIQQMLLKKTAAMISFQSAKVDEDIMEKDEETVR